MPGQSRRARPQEGLTAGARPGARAFPLRGSDAGARSLHRRQRQGRQRLPRWQDRALELFSFRLHLFRTLEVPRRDTLESTDKERRLGRARAACWGTRGQRAGCC